MTLTNTDPGVRITTACTCAVCPDAACPENIAHTTQVGRGECVECGCELLPARCVGCHAWTKNWLHETVLKDWQHAHPAEVYEIEGVNLGWEKLSGFKDVTTADDWVGMIAPLRGPWTQVWQVVGDKLVVTQHTPRARSGETYTITATGL